MNGKTKGKGKYYNKPNNRNSSKNGYNSKGSSNVPKDRDFDEIKSNDISWYNKIDPVYREATRIPFNRILGDSVRTTGNFNNYDSPIAVNNSAGVDGAIPGIMRINYVPTIGYADSPNDPVNRAFTTIYGDIYSKTTGAMQFTQASLAFFITSMSSIATVIAYIKRAIEISNVWNSWNYYYPRSIISSMSLNFDDLVVNKDSYRMQVNELILNFNALKVPQFLDLFARHYSLAHNIYCDEDSVKAQLYYFAPEYVYKYIDTENRLQAKLTPGHEEAMTVALQEWIDLGEELIEAWRHSSDLGIISGSIQRAYKDANLVSIDMIQENDFLVPKFDRNIMWQIHNMTAMQVIIPDITENVSHDTLINKLVMYRSVANEWYMTRPYQIIDSYDDNTSDEFVMESTRLMLVPDLLNVDGDDPTLVNLKGAGTEIVLHFYIYQLGTSLIGGAPSLYRFGPYQSVYTIELNDNNVISDYTNGFNQVLKLSAFQHGPRIYPLGAYSKVAGGDITAIRTLPQMGNMYNYTTIDYDSYFGLSRAAQMSMFKVSDVSLR